MGLHRLRPEPSSRMGILWTLSTIRQTAVLEFGSVGHMIYADALLERANPLPGCRRYTTHLDETDISLGRVSKLRAAAADIAARDHPAAIFLLPSSVPEMIGTDLAAICDELQGDMPGLPPLLPFADGGFQYSHAKGVEQTLLGLAKRFAVQPYAPEKLRYNLIGSCADLFRFRADEDELNRLLRGAFGADILCSLSAGVTVGSITQMGRAALNLVLRREGIPAAKWLQQQHGTPWLLGRPYGIKQTMGWLTQVGQLFQVDPDEAFLAQEAQETDQILTAARRRLDYAGRGGLALGGHADVVSGIGAFAQEEAGLPLAARWCDAREMSCEEAPWLDEQARLAQVEKCPHGIVMASGELLSHWKKPLAGQIAWPGPQWEVNPYEPPFVGTRGAAHLLSLWVNALAAS